VVGAVYDDGVGIRDVDAVLYDGGRYQYVVVVVDKVRDDLLQLAWLHLAVSRRHTGIGHVLLYEMLQMGQGRDAVGHDVDLSVAAHFKVHGVGNHLVAEGVHLGLYGAAVGRRSLDDGKVAGAHQRELEGARDRCGRHCEGVDVGFEGAQFLLDGDPELLFLVYDEQAQVVPFHRSSDEFVGADENIDFPFGQLL